MFNLPQHTVLKVVCGRNGPHKTMGAELLVTQKNKRVMTFPGSHRGQLELLRRPPPQLEVLSVKVFNFCLTSRLGSKSPISLQNPCLNKCMAPLVNLIPHHFVLIPIKCCKRHGSPVDCHTIFSTFYSFPEGAVGGSSVPRIFGCSNPQPEFNPRRLSAKLGGSGHHFLKSLVWLGCDQTHNLSASVAQPLDDWAKITAAPSHSSSHYKKGDPSV